MALDVVDISKTSSMRNTVQSTSGYRILAVTIANEAEASNSASALWLRDGVGCLTSSGEPQPKEEIAYLSAYKCRKTTSQFSRVVTSAEWRPVRSVKGACHITDNRNLWLDPRDDI